jgi:hypothetical protein
MGSENEQHGPSGGELGSRKPWVPMSMQYLGRLGDLVLTGEGKPMISLGDPGEPTRKPTGTPG